MEFPRFWKVQTESNESEKIVLSPSVLVREKGDLTSQSRSGGAPIKFTSSEVSDSNLWLIYPDVAFLVCYNHYKTSGKFFNVVESYVSEVKTRKHSWKGDDEAAIAKMEEWADDVNITNIKEVYTRDILVTGNYLYGYSDWQPVPITNVVGLKRDDFGNVQEYWYRGAKNQLKLLGTPKEFGHEKYIAIGKDAWGYGMAFALMSTYIDTEGNVSMSALDGDKQIFQDFLKIYHKYASPRSIWSFPGATNPDDFNAENPLSLAARVKSMKAGDRLAMPMEAVIVSEEINAQARFTDGIEKIVDPEIGGGLQSTANRLINDPSAMADAKEANSKDDTRASSIMQDFLEWINNVVIPKVVGPDADIEFVWGSQDDFQFDPNLAMMAFEKNIVGISEVRKMFADSGMPLNDDLFKKDQEDKMQQQKDMLQHQADTKAQAFGDDDDGPEFGDGVQKPKPAEPKDKDNDDLKEAKIEAYRAIVKKLRE